LLARHRANRDRLVYKAKMTARRALKRLLNEYALDGPLRPVTARAYGAAVACELAFERMLDAVAPREREHRLLGELTAVVKTFERPKVARRLVASIRTLHPTLRIVVVDDSRDPVDIDGADTYSMPYDSGIGAGRNEALRHARSEYVLILDDDYVLSRHTQLVPALTLMERYAEIDIMGGQLIDLPLYTRRPLNEVAGSIYPTSAEPRAPIGSSIGGLVVCEKVPTFFIARRARLRSVAWDPLLKRIDHADFFTRAFGVLTTVFNPRLQCFHARTPFDEKYMAKRLDLDESRRILAERYAVPVASAWIPPPE
jgi:glycosyltransferase involved in cell wall biosynthesis